MTIDYDDCLKRGKIKLFSRGPDYYNRWSQAGCEKLIKLAEEFLEIAKNAVLR